MSHQRRKKTREQDVTGRYLAGDFDEDHADKQQRFSDRSKNAQQDKIMKTAALRAANDVVAADAEALPIGEVVQVHSLFYEVDEPTTGQHYLCTARKTLNKVSDTSVIVGDRVHFRANGRFHESGKPEGVIEQILPRQTVLTRTSSFKGIEQHPIVANAQQMLIVASVVQPQVKWGLIDRMLIAAQGGGLTAILCLNKVDLMSLQTGPEGPDDPPDAQAAMAHYASLGIRTVRTSIETREGLDALRDLLKDRVTVLAGTSGVGKSSLIRAIQPQIDIRVGEVSEYTAKGRHTTTSARRYALDFGGAVVDTPGVKVFGLWGVTRENLMEFFPDVEAGSAPIWRKESYQRIEASLA